MGETFGKFEKYAEIFHAVPTPSYVVMEELLRRNLAVLRDLQQETGAYVLLAQKAFSMFRFYPLIAEYLAGAAASGLFEARLAYEEMKGKENHVFSPAFKAEDIVEIVKIADHIVFNSFAQWEKYGELALKHGCACGLRINPEHSTQEHAIYDPCSAGSRLGVKCGDFRPDKMEGLTGLHFHTLCEQGAEPLAETLEAVEEKFGAWLPQMEWINFGGGHHITREGYDIDLLKQCIVRMQTKYGLKVYIEPGEAIALDAKKVIPCCVYLEGEYGEKELCVGVPIVLGKDGFEKVVDVKLEGEEKAKFDESVVAAREVNAQLGDALK